MAMLQKKAEHIAPLFFINSLQEALFEKTQLA
jgi:hypothetical protein